MKTIVDETTRKYEVLFEVKQRSNATIEEIVSVKLTDIESSMGEGEIETWARYEAEQKFYSTKQYREHGKYWKFQALKRA